MLTKRINTVYFAIAVKINISTKTLYLMMGIMFALLIIIIVVYVIQELHKKRMWEGTQNRKGKFTERVYKTIYKSLLKNPLTRSYMEKVSYHFCMISPSDSEEIAKKSIITCVISWSLCLFAFFGIYVLNFRLINLIISGVTIVLINLEAVARMAKHYKLKSYEETMMMLEDIIHFYYTEHRVDDAIYQARDCLSKNMKYVANQIYQLLLSENKEDEIREFNENVPNRFLRALVNQCVIAMEMGEQEVSGKILFIRNLENLQKELDIEIEKMKELDMVFMGVILCITSPIFFIELSKQFAVYLKNDMNAFYYGEQGFLCDIALLTLISFTYFIMRKNAEYITVRQSEHQWLFALDKIPLLHKVMDNYCDKYASKMEQLKRTLRNSGYNIRPRHFVLRSFLISFLVFCISIGTIYYLHDLSRKQERKAEKSEVELLSSAADESQYENMGNLIEAYVAKYIEKQTTSKISKDEIAKELDQDGTIVNKLIKEALADDIVRRINNYRNEYFSLGDLLLSLILSVIACYLPSIVIYYNSSASKDAMEDEVNQFNATIGMLMYFDSMTILQILEELESYSVIFRESIRICINDYGSSDTKALEEMKEREPFEPFRRIIDNFMRCDDMPIYEAFHELDMDRDGYISRRKLANKKSIKKRAFRAFLLGVLPWFALISYCIAPPLIASMRDLDVLTEELNNSSW